MLIGQQQPTSALRGLCLMFVRDAFWLGAFASRGGDGGPIQTLIAAMGLMAILAEEEPEPHAEIMSLAAEDAWVEAEIDRAGEAIDREFEQDAGAEEITSALEAPILGTAIILTGCTRPEGQNSQAMVRLRAARCLTRLAAGLMAMNAAGSALSSVVPTRPVA